MNKNALQAIQPAVVDEGHLDRVLREQPTVPSREQQLRDKGYTILEAGVVRRVRVNRKWISISQDDWLSPFIVQEGNSEKKYKEVEMLGACAMKSSEQASGCSIHRSAWIETNGPVAVK